MSDALAVLLGGVLSHRVCGGGRGSIFVPGTIPFPVDSVQGALPAVLQRGRWEQEALGSRGRRGAPGAPTAAWLFSPGFSLPSAQQDPRHEKGVCFNCRREEKIVPGRQWGGNEAVLWHHCCTSRPDPSGED